MKHCLLETYSNPRMDRFNIDRKSGINSKPNLEKYTSNLDYYGEVYDPFYLGEDSIFNSVSSPGNFQRYAKWNPSLFYDDVMAYYDHKNTYHVYTIHPVTRKEYYDVYIDKDKMGFNTLSSLYYSDDKRVVIISKDKSSLFEEGFFR